MVVNTNSIVHHVIQINNNIIINVNVNVKSIVREKNIKFGSLAHVFERKVSI